VSGTCWADDQADVSCRQAATNSRIANSRIAAAAPSKARRQTSATSGPYQFDQQGVLAAMEKKRKTLMWILAGVVGLLVVGAIAAGPIMSRVEEPAYKVARDAGAIQIRDYGSMIAAEAQVQGERKPAIEEGFRLIAGYIFGGNTPNAKIAMTAPVQQQAQQKIAMTAPVTQQTTPAQGNDGMSWTVRFIMPAGYSMETLPAPKDARVTLKAVPAKRMAVIRFAGTADEALITTKTAELNAFLAANQLKPTGTPVLAFYNPPWTLPLLRRNEIMLELTAGG
jgi:hypothetical protein